MCINILSNVLTFFKIKKSWRIPKKAKIIIYDHHFYFYFHKYINKSEYVIYHNRIESDSEINILIVLECLINFDFKLIRKHYHRVLF